MIKRVKSRMFQDLEDKSTSFEVLPKDSMEEVRVDEFLWRPFGSVLSCIVLCIDCTIHFTSFYF